MQTILHYIKSYVKRIDVRKALDFNLYESHVKFDIQNIFCYSSHKRFQNIL